MKGAKLVELRKGDMGEKRKVERARGVFDIESLGESKSESL